MLKPYDFNRNSGITEPEIISFSRNTALLTRTLSCSPNVTVCSCVGLGLGLGLGNRVRVRNRV